MFAIQAALLTSAILLAGCDNDPPSSSLPRVAHAGGGYKNWAYTNSHEALEFNRQHFTLFEIDLAWTADEQLVCLHDWELNAEWIFGQSLPTVPTLAEFEGLVEVNPYVKNCTLETLTQWLKANPGKRLVTDFKTNEVQGLELLATHFDTVGDHVIAQIYTPEQYHRVRELGYYDVIWSLYRIFPAPLNEILQQTKEMDLFAVTMPRAMAERGDANALNEAGIQSYVHTINTQRELEYFQTLGVDEIYTDWLAP